MNWLNGIFREDYKVEIKSYSGLTVENYKKVKAKFILRGLRTSADFEFERGIGQINRKLSDNIETVFFLTEAIYTPLSSSIVRDVIRNGGSVEGMIPHEVNF